VSTDGFHFAAPVALEDRDGAELEHLVELDVELLAAA
jgi:hypothetical protein